MTFWEKVLVFGGLAAVCTWIIWGKVQQLLAERSPGARQVRQLIEEVRFFLEHRADPERARAEGLPAPKLSPELTAGIENGLKLLVLCQASEHPELEVPPKKSCAVFLVTKDQRHLRLVVSTHFERTARAARELGKLLNLPVEMV